MTERPEDIIEPASSPERQPPAELDQISDRVRDAFDQVPSIGNRWNRWYDIPYKVLWFFQTRWRRKLIPQRALNKLYRWSMDLSQFNALERHKIWDPTDELHDFTVPADEHVTIPSLWVVELFPPSQLGQLEKALETNGWDEKRRLTGTHESNQEMLARSRARSGWQWWHMTTVQGTNGQYFLPDGVRMRLPEEFSLIDVKAIQISSGLTAVVAHFSLSNAGASSVDDAWHQPHEPEIVRRNGVRQAEERMWAGFRTTQAARARLHDLAKDWMRQNCPGIFAESAGEHTSIDMLLMDKHDPSASVEVDRELDDAFRALGLTEHGLTRYASTAVPQMLLIPTNTSLARSMKTNRTWALWGQRDAIVTAFGDQLRYAGSEPNRAIAGRMSDGIGGFAVTLAISDMLETFEARHATIRDKARTRHGRFKAKVIEDLRSHLLTLSMDIATVQRDLETFWKFRPRFPSEAEFAMVRMSRQPREPGEVAPRSEPDIVNAGMRERQKEWLEQLTFADKDYRDIVTTVASLGASVDATKTGRRALWVAMVSLVVAVATVVVADVGDQSLAHKIGSLFHL